MLFESSIVAHTQKAINKFFCRPHILKQNFKSQLEIFTQILPSTTHFCQQTVNLLLVKMKVAKHTLFWSASLSLP